MRYIEIQIKKPDQKKEIIKPSLFSKIKKTIKNIIKR